MCGYSKIENTKELEDNTIVKSSKKKKSQYDIFNVKIL